MPLPDDVYVHCDELDRIPPLFRENWETELSLLVERLPRGAKVLQVGSMDGTRMIALLRRRGDLDLTGIEIEESLVKLCRKNLESAKLRGTVVHGDITAPPALPPYDYVICLNNTLGYIPDEQAAVEQMRRLGKRVIVSVYGERFDDQLAQLYFGSLGLEVQRREDDTFILKDFTNVRRYPRSSVETWGGAITETPLGHFCEFEGYGLE